MTLTIYDRDGNRLPYTCETLEQAAAIIKAVAKAEEARAATGRTVAARNRRARRDKLKALGEVLPGQLALLKGYEPAVMPALVVRPRGPRKKAPR